MPIQKGDKLKSLVEFERMVMDEFNRHHPGLDWRPESVISGIGKSMARAMYDQQLDYHNLILSMGYGGQMPSSKNVSINHDYTPQSLEDALKSMVDHFSHKPDTKSMREQIQHEVDRINRTYGVTAVWNQATNTIDVTMDPPPVFVDFTIDDSPVKKSCNHEYVEKQLFTSTFKACKHCGKEPI